MKTLMKTTYLLLFVCISSVVSLTTCQSKQNMVIDDAGDIGVPAVAYQAPIIILMGGTYTGNYKSTDPKVPAVWVQTNEPVEITGCIIASAGDMIRCSGGTRVKIHHNSLFGIAPDNNHQWGRALDNYQPRYLIFENNYVEHTGGLLIDHTDSNSKSVVIRYNIIRNTDKRRGDLSAGESRAGILFITVAKVAGEISWNQFINLPDKSHIENNIYITSVLL